MASEEFIRKLRQENGLDHTDVWEMTRGRKTIPIITRTGIEKIQAKQGIDIAFEAHVLERNFAVVKATATKGDLKIETFASALCGNGGNSQSNYVVEMAEKRALSRAVLKTVGAYAWGVYGQDESEEFSEEQPPSPSPEPAPEPRHGYGSAPPPEPPDVTPITISKEQYDEWAALAQKVAQEQGGESSEVMNDGLAHFGLDRGSQVLIEEFDELLELASKWEKF